MLGLEKELLLSVILCSFEVSVAIRVGPLSSLQAKGIYKTKLLFDGKKARKRFNCF